MEHESVTYRTARPRKYALTGLKREADSEIRLGKIDSAIAKYQQIVRMRAKAIAQPERLSTAHADLGAAYLHKGMNGSAYRECIRAAKMCPDNAEAHFSLAEVLRDSGRPKLALAEYGLAV